jgi:hypothetical protein
MRRILLTTIVAISLSASARAADIKVEKIVDDFKKSYSLSASTEPSILGSGVFTVIIIASGAMDHRVSSVSIAVLFGIPVVDGTITGVDAYDKTGKQLNSIAFRNNIKCNATCINSGVALFAISEDYLHAIPSDGMQVEINPDRGAPVVITITAAQAKAMLDAIDANAPR